jgi:hypothetical protein
MLLAWCSIIEISRLLRALALARLNFFRFSGRNVSGPLAHSTEVAT